MTAAADIVARLRAAGCVFAEEEAGLLLDAGVEGLPRLLERRIAGEPLEAVLGWARFDGSRIVMASGVFVPRRRSELLVAEVSALIRRSSVVVDLCCGSGAIGAAVAARVPGAQVYGADIDARAVNCARRNLPPERVFEGDLYAALPDRLRGQVDVLVANAPYVPSADIELMPREARLHEPRAALDGGPDGLDWHRSIATGAPMWLRSGGSAVIETSRLQAAATRRICAAAGLHARVVRSTELDATAVIARSGRIASRSPGRR